MNKKLFSLIACATMFLQSVSSPMYAMKNNKSNSNSVLKVPTSRKEIEDHMFETICEIRSNATNEEIKNAIGLLVKDGLVIELLNIGLKKDAVFFIIQLLENSLININVDSREKFEIKDGNIGFLTLIMYIFDDLRDIVLNRQ